MTLEEYIVQINAELSLGIEDEVGKCKRYIYSEAEQLATNNCACIDNETVKEWIIYYAENRPEGYDEEEVECVAEEPKKEPVRQKKEKKEEKQNESIQLSLFGI